MQEEIKHRRASRGSSCRASLTMSRADGNEKELAKPGGVRSDLSDPTDVLSAVAEVAELDDKKETGPVLDAAQAASSVSVAPRKTVRMMPSQENVVVTLYDFDHDHSARSHALV